MHFLQMSLFCPPGNIVECYNTLENPRTFLAAPSQVRPPGLLYELHTVWLLETVQPTELALALLTNTKFISPNSQHLLPCSGARLQGARLQVTVGL